MLCAFLLSGCGQSAPTGNTTQSTVSAPPSTSSSATNSTSSGGVSLSPLLPPGGDERPPPAGSLGRPLGSDGLPTMQPARGTSVGVDNLFAEDIRDPIERIERVETAVTELRRDLDAAMPSILRLVAVEKDIQELIGQLETLTSEQPASGGGDDTALARDMAAMEAAQPPQQLQLATPRSAPQVEQADEQPASIAEIENPAPQDGTASSLSPLDMAAPEQAPTEQPQTQQAASAPRQDAPATQPAPAPETKANPATPAESAGSGSPAIQGLRIGEHPGMTRLVLDANKTVAHTHDLDNGEHLLVIELPGMAWNAAKTGKPSSPAIKSWSTQAMDGGGTRLILVLSQDVTVAASSLLKPAPGTSLYRIVLDLKPASAPKAAQAEPATPSAPPPSDQGEILSGG